MIWAYLTFLVLLPWLGEGTWPTIFLRYLPPVVFLLPLVLMLLTRRVARAPALLCLVAFLTLDSGLALHRPGRGDLRVLSWNLHGGACDRAAVQRGLARLQPDIVLLQEARGEPDPLPGLVGSYHLVRGGHQGELAILSRFPVQDSGRLDLWPSRPGLWAELAGGLRVIDVHYGVGDPGQHLFHNRHGFRAYLLRTAQARREQTLALEPALTERVLVGGDFNSPPGSFPQVRLSRRLHDAHASAGLGFGLSFPADRPLWRIDHLYSSLQPVDCQVLDLPGSDHRPVLATFRL